MLNDYGYVMTRDEFKDALEYLLEGSASLDSMLNQLDIIRDSIRFAKGHIEGDKMIKEAILDVKEKILEKEGL